MLLISEFPLENFERQLVVYNNMCLFQPGAGAVGAAPAGAAAPAQGLDAKLDLARRLASRINLAKGNITFIHCLYIMLTTEIPVVRGGESPAFDSTFYSSWVVGREPYKMCIVQVSSQNFT